MLWGTLCPIPLHVAPRDAVRVSPPTETAQASFPHKAIDAGNQKLVEPSRDRLPHSKNA
jgi:hypothetical protein